MFLVNESVDKATGLQLKLCLLTVFVTAETVLLPDFRSNTRPWAPGFQLDLKPTRDDSKTAAQLLLSGSTTSQLGD